MEDGRAGRIGAIAGGYFGEEAGVFVLFSGCDVHFDQRDFDGDYVVVPEVGRERTRIEPRMDADGERERWDE